MIRKKDRVYYHDEDDCPGNIMVVWKGKWYTTGNRYQTLVELYKDGEFVRCVEISKIYSVRLK